MRFWEVWRGSTLICSRYMRLNRDQAENKVRNEGYGGTFMEALPASQFYGVKDSPAAIAAARGQA